MYNLTTDILARLQKGENVEDIATELTKSINEANEQYKAEEKAKAEAAAAEKEKASAKKAAIEQLLLSISNVLEAWDAAPDIVAEIDEFTDEDVQHFIHSIDTVLPLIVKSIEMQSAIQEVVNPKEKKKTATAADKDPIQDFLNEFIR